MAYLVRIMPRAERDLEAIFTCVQAQNSQPAKRWFNGLVDSIESLSQHPQRHPIVPEDANLHHLLYGNKPHIYRVIYSIDIADQKVSIIHIRHHSRDVFKPKEPHHR